MTTTEQLPKARVIKIEPTKKRGDFKIYVHCPFCGRIHTHTGMPSGERVSHCAQYGLPAKDYELEYRG